MEITYDSYSHDVEPYRIYLGTPDNKKICVLNGIRPETVNLQLKLNNTYEITFTVDKFLSFWGNRIESNGYSWLTKWMRIYVEHIGWFIMEQPTAKHDGIEETKEITADSIDVEFLQHDIVGLKINQGTTDSYEMLVEGNVDVDEYTGVERAKQNIKFYNKDNPELSLLHIILKITDLNDWSIGYIDPVPKVYTVYEDGNKHDSEPIMLQDEIGYFDISSQTAYAFLTQTIERYFECLILFDVNNSTINAYRVENIGKDTNINIGFRNLQNTNSISVDEGSIYTRYTVNGADDLGIIYANFGSNTIENIEYFLNAKYLPSELIEKYKTWKNFVESKRPEYIELSRKYNSELGVITELKNRVPLDDCSTDWDSFSLEDLNNTLSDYQAEKTGIENLFKDDKGNLDFAALQASDLAPEYNQVVNVIIPNIEAAIHNKNITKEDEKIKPVEDTDWTHYGLDELSVKIKSYEGQKSALSDGGYSEPYVEGSDHTKEYHDARYKEYQELCYQLDPLFSGGCAEAYELRKKEVESHEDTLKKIGNDRTEMVKSVEKSTWKHTDTSGNETSFSSDDLCLLNKLYNDTDYVNENMFLVSTDDQVKAIDEQIKLYDAAVNDLDSISQPQFKYTATLDNFLAMTQYQDFSKELELGNYIRLDIRDDYQVKLRVVAINFNPANFDNELTIEFSNMIKSKSKRSDIAYLLDSNNSSGKNQISGSSNNSTKNEDSLSVRYILNQIFSSTAFKDKVSTVVNSELGGYIGKLLVLKQLEAEMIKCTDITVENGFFQYLQAQLIAVGQVVAESGDFKKLDALVANIDNLLSGTVSAELGHIIKLTAQNVTIDEAVIRDLIAAQITVAMLKAGDISSNSFRIVSNDGGLEIFGNTMQFKDTNDVVRIQIGRDTNNNFTFCLYDETGKGVLIDSYGIKESAISDGMIKTNMIETGAVTEDKIDKTNIRDWTDSSGNKVFDISKLYYGNDKFEVSYNSTVKKVTATSSKVDTLWETVNDIEIGSRNLIVGSSDATVGPQWSQSGWSGLFETFNAEERTYKLTALNGWHSANYQLSEEYNGKQITISLMAKLLSSKTTSTSANWLGVNTPSTSTELKATRFLKEDGTPMEDLPEKDKWMRLHVTATVNNLFRTGICTANSPESKGLKTTWLIKDLKMEKGNKVTDWTPAPEDIDSSISNVKDNLDNLQIGGRNYIKHGKGDVKDGFFKYFSKVLEGYGEGTITSKNTYSAMSIGEGFILDCRDYEVGREVVFSYDFMYTAWDFPEGTDRTELWMGQRYTAQTVPGGSTVGMYIPVTAHNLPVVGENGCELNKWVHVENVLTIPQQAADGIGTQSAIQLRNTNANVSASITFRIKNVKIEYGNKATDWTPSPEDIQGQITTVKDTISQVNVKVDNNAKKIELKASKTEMTEAINNYDQSKVQTLRDTIATQTTEIGKINANVSDIETIVGTDPEGQNYDKSLAQKIADVTTTANGINQTLSSLYMNNDAVKEYVTSEIEQKADKISSDVENKLNGQNTLIHQTADEIQNVVGKKLFEPIKLRYVRDWLLGNNKDTQNRFVECKVITEKNVNLAKGKVPTAHKLDLTPITGITNLSIYTDEVVDSNYIYHADCSLLQLDLGSVHEDISTIIIYHYYSDSRQNDSKVEISEDGKNWITLYDSTINGKYAETSKGYTHLVRTESVADQISFLKQTLNSFSVAIKENEDNYSTVLQTVKSHTTKIQETEDKLGAYSEQIQDANGWKLKLAQIGAYDEYEEQVETCIDMNAEEGITVSSTNKRGYKTKLQPDRLLGTYNDGISGEEEVFSVSGDLTRSKRFKTETGVDFNDVMKAIPIVNFKGKNILAFVKGGGNS